MKKILLPALLLLAVACGSPEKADKEQITESSPDNEYADEGMEEAAPAKELPEDINMERGYLLENDTIRQALSFTLESADDMYLLYAVQDADLTCVLRYEGAATAASAVPELQEQAEQMEVDFPAQRYIFRDELCSFVVFLAEDRSQVAVRPLECSEEKEKCVVYSVANIPVMESATE